MNTNWSLIQELATDFGGELVGVNEFASLAGFDRSTAAQLRAERKRDQTGFPPVVSESGRSFLHRLIDLVDWVENSRYVAMAEINDRQIAVWRLERRTRSLVETMGVDPTRRLFAALAVASITSPRELQPAQLLQRAIDGDDELAAHLTDNPVHLPKPAVGPLVEEIARCAAMPSTLDQSLVELGNHQPGIPHRTPADLACLTAAVLDAQDGDIVYEPTSGECEILLRVAELASARSQSLVSIGGSDSDPEASLIGRARLRLAGTDAMIGSEATPGTVQRLLIDPGSTTERRNLAHWARLLHRDGRAVIITRVLGADPDLVAEFPPHAIIFPPQRNPTTQGALVLWVSEPFRDRPQSCTIVDLRGSATLDAQPLSARFDVLAEALKLNPQLPDDHADYCGALNEALSAEPQISVIDSSELEDQLQLAVAGSIGIDPAILEENEAYALVLARELERLIGGRSIRGGPAARRRPHTSPDGVLAGKTTDEARRVVARLADTFAGVRQWTRRTT